MRATCPICGKRVPLTVPRPEDDYSAWLRRHFTWQTRRQCHGSFMAVKIAAETHSDRRSRAAAGL